MANAKLDQNGVATMTGLLNTDGVTIVNLKADPTTHSIEASDGSTGSDNGGNHGIPDGNFRTTMFAQSSAGDGALVALYINSSGQLLIKST